MIPLIGAAAGVLSGIFGGGAAAGAGGLLSGVLGGLGGPIGGILQNVLGSVGGDLLSNLLGGLFGGGNKPATEVPAEASGNPLENAIPMLLEVLKPKLPGVGLEHSPALKMFDLLGDMLAQGNSAGVVAAFARE